VHSASERPKHCLAFAERSKPSPKKFVPKNKINEHRAGGAGYRCASPYAAALKRKPWFGLYFEPMPDQHHQYTFTTLNRGATTPRKQKSGWGKQETTIGFVKAGATKAVNNN